jgi:uncharacterized protein YjbI with pentapeptide repeats
MSEKLSYEESCRFLQREGWEPVGDIPPMLERPPGYDDEILGLSFFRTWVEDAKLENLTIPRTYFSRAKVNKFSFVGTDLTESVANWNDFEDVDFSSSDLTRVDLRACVLRRVRFDNALMKNADLRCCGFEECTFVGADLTETKITREAGTLLNLSPEQHEQVSWQDADGPDPDGG